MNHGDDPFWTAVHEALDERRDPLEDDHLRTMLAVAPGRQDILLRLESRLAMLAAGAIERRRPPVLLWGGVAASFLCGVLFLVFTRAERTQACEMPAVRAPAVLRFQSDHAVHSHRRVTVRPLEPASPDPVLTMTTTQEIFGAFR